MIAIVKRLWRDLRAQDIVEWALLAGLVAVAGASLLPVGVAQPVSTIFSKVGSTIVRFGG